MKHIKFAYSKHSGYDISRLGDSRYCKTVATLRTGKTIQQAFDEIVAELPVMEPESYYPYLLGCYREWANEHPYDMRALEENVAVHNNVVRDKLAVSVLTHARALAQILNEIEGKRPEEDEPIVLNNIIEFDFMKNAGV